MTIIQTLTLVHSMYQAGQRPPVCKTSPEQSEEVRTREIAECVPDKLPDVQPAENSEEENQDAGLTLVIDERGKIRNEEFDNQENRRDPVQETTNLKPKKKRRRRLLPASPVRKSKRAKSEHDTEEFFAEKIIQTKIKKGIRQFKVIWKGFGIKDATWEPVENIQPIEVVEKFRQQNSLS